MLSGLTFMQNSTSYGNEADVLNISLFDIATIEWQDKNIGQKEIFQNYADINELVCFSNRNKVMSL
jgi:hypothetical protein